MKAIINKEVIPALRIIAMVWLGISANTAQAQYKAEPKPAAKLNRFAIGLRFNHLYDVKFKPNQVLDNGFVAEDMKGLNGSHTKFDMAFGVDASYFFSPLFSMDLAYDKGKMTGSGEFEYYESDVEFYTLGANLSLKRAVRTKQYRLVPYLRASITSASFNAQRRFKEDNAVFSTTKDNCMQVGLGLGMRYHITGNLHLNLMSEFVTSYTDAWDGYDYSNGNDHIVKTTLGIRYTFGKNNHVDRTLAWQDKRVDDLVAAGNGNNNELMNQALRALSDSLRVMHESMMVMQNELKDKMAHENADTDKDGVLDRNDGCPDQYGPAYNNGCPDTARLAKTEPAAANQLPEDVKQSAPQKAPAVLSNANINLAEARKMLLIEMNNIRFPAGRATLDEAALDVLNRNAVVMQANPSFKLVITGYTDSEGSRQLNMKLSKQRASAVANYLAKAGVPRHQLEVKAMGSKNPVDKRKTKRANSYNRRVEFTVELLNQ